MPRCNPMEFGWKTRSVLMSVQKDTT